MLKSVDYQEWRNATPPAFAQQQPFNIRIPVDRRWDSASRRILVVLEHVDTEDLRARKLLVGPSGSWVRSAIDLGTEYAAGAGKNQKLAAFAAINFNYFKTYDLENDGASAAAAKAAVRVHAWIKKHKPTDVIVFGDNAAASLMNTFGMDERRLLLMRGRPHKHEDVWWTNTISLSSAYQGKFAAADDDEDEAESKIDHANLLGYVGRCCGNALMRELVYRINLKANAQLVTDYADFKSLYRRLMQADRVSVDTETASLGRVVNKLLTIQFSLDADTSYIIAVDHKDARWTPLEHKRIVRGLRNFFGRDFDPLSTRYDQYLIGQNLKFDLTVLRQRLQLHSINWRVWDLMAGEFCFHPETLVDTNRGRVSIQTICADAESYLVKSFNHTTKQIEYKPLVMTSVHQPAERMMRLVYEGGTLYATANHKVWSNTREAYVRLCDIKPGEDVIVEPPFAKC